jgi:hypothetical protein
MDRSRRRRLTFAALAVTAATLLAACGDDDDSTATTASTASTESTTSGTSTASSGSDTTDASATTTAGSGGGEVGSKQDYVDAAESAIRFDDEDLRGCVAEALVSDDVYAAIQKAGLSVDDFKTGQSMDKLSVSEDQAAAVADEMAACGDLLPEILPDDEDQLSCAKGNMSNDQVAQLLSYSLFQIDLPEDLQAANDAVEKCVQGATSTAPSTTS